MRKSYNSQLDALKAKCEKYGDMLEVQCEDVNDTLKDKTEKYDIIVVNSLLIHFCIIYLTILG